MQDIVIILSKKYSEKLARFERAREGYDNFGPIVSNAYNKYVDLDAAARKGSASKYCARKAKEVYQSFKDIRNSYCEEALRYEREAKEFWNLIQAAELIIGHQDKDDARDFSDQIINYFG